MIGEVTQNADVVRSYRILGVDPSASPADVKRAFRTLVRRLHPDANPAAENGDLSAIVDAYRRLGRAGLVFNQPAPAPRHIDVYA